MKIHGTAKGAALSTKDFGVAFGAAADTGTVPNTVDDLYAWWDFSGEYSTITKDGSNRVSKVTNGESSTNLDMEQGTADNKPLWLSGNLNGKDTIDFVDDRYLQTDDAYSNVPSVSQPVTYFWVCDIPSTDDHYLFDRGSGWGENYDESRQNSLKDSSNRWTSASASWTMTSTGQWSYLTSIFNGAAGLFRENGVENSAGAKDTGTRQISAGTIGAKIWRDAEPSAASFWNSEVAEIIMYDRELSTAEIEGIELYLSTRWGL
jgi:hypothetical protein